MPSRSLFLNCLLPPHTHSFRFTVSPSSHQPACLSVCPFFSHTLLHQRSPASTLRTSSLLFTQSHRQQPHHFLYSSL
ncbi:hypothetical protein LZ31DRAFT_150970 [Colletotrichum somersetense]|nr:hypothetical protein LZ31DRAFT_150970 [Colletotrichum somersetense]